MNLEEGYGLVNYNPKITNAQAICDYIDDVGFEAVSPFVSSSKKDDISNCVLDIKGMTCNSCVQSIEGMPNVFLFP